MGVENSRQPKLTKNELEILQFTWGLIMKNPEESGACIFKTFLRRYNYYYKFHKLFGIPASEITNNSFFRKHASLIIHEINHVVLHVEKDSVIKTRLINLGKIHGKRRVSENQFEELRGVILEYMIEEFKVEGEVIAAWNKTFDMAFTYIFEGIKQGN